MKISSVAAVALACLAAEPAFADPGCGPPRVTNPDGSITVRFDCPTFPPSVPIIVTRSHRAETASYVIAGAAAVTLIGAAIGLLHRPPAPPIPEAEKPPAWSR